MAASRKKHVPQRTCVVCRTSSAKRELTRLVHTADGGVQPDSSGKLPGRGAYLCSDPKCWHQAAQSDVLARALRVSLSPEDRERVALAAPEMN